MLNPAEKLVEGYGGRSAVAAAFEVSSEAVRLWLKQGIPADRALEAEEKTRGKGRYAVSAIEVLRYAKEQRAAA